MALAGFVAKEDAIEHTMVHLLGEAFDPSALTDGLGHTWMIADSNFRLRACCNPIYPVLDALEDALAELDAKPGEVERIDAATWKFAAGMGEADPPNHFAARYSLPHAAAALVINGHLGYASFTDAAVRDPAIAALRQRVTLVEDPQMTAATPRLKPARVTVVLKDGRSCTKARDDDRRAGQRTDPAEVRDKFRGLAGLVLTKAGVAAVESAIDEVETWPTMAPLIDALHRGSPGV
jgi:2-methylcitrate dehydratase PrpD